MQNRMLLKQGYEDTKYTCRFDNVPLKIESKIKFRSQGIRKARIRFLSDSFASNGKISTLGTSFKNQKNATL
jgi:hypothetical protein